MFGPMLFIFGTVIGYSVKMITKVSDHRYDLEVKGQVQFYLRTMLRLETQTSFSFSLRGC